MIQGAQQGHSILPVVRRTSAGAVTAALLAAAAPAWAGQAPPEEVVEVPEVVVGGTRPVEAPVDPRKVPANVTVITAEEIRRSGAQTIQDALQRVPGIDIAPLFGNRFQQQSSMRGFSGIPVPAATVLVDGVEANLTEPLFNQAGTGLVPLESIERIEVIPGPGYIGGRNATAGVINIVTKRGGEKSVAVGEVAGGSFNAKRFFGSVRGPLPGGFDYYLSAKRETEDGFRDFSDGRVTQAHGRVGYRLRDETNVTFNYDRTESTLKFPLQITPAELERDRTTSAPPGETGELVHVFSMNARQRFPAGFSVSVNGFLHPHTVEAGFGFRVGGRFDGKTDTSAGGGRGEIAQTFRLGPARNQIAAGAEYRREDTNVRGAASGIAGLFIPPTDQSLLRDNVGLYLQDILDLFDQVTLTAGLRYDRTLSHFIDRLAPSTNTFPRYERVTPRAGITYNPLKEVGAYFSYAEGFRPPTLFEILGFGLGGADPRVRPALTRAYEVGLRGRAGDWLEGSAAAFWTRTRNDLLIQPVTLVAFNVPVTRRNGFELSLRPRYRGLADGFIAYTFTQATFASDFPTINRRTGLVVSVQDGNLLPDIPKHRLSAGVNLRPFTGATLSFSGLYVTRQVLESDFINAEPKLDAYFVLNAKALYEYRSATFFVQGKNILNNHYETIGIFGTLTAAPPANRYLIPAPGWSVEAGMSYRYELPF